LNKILSIISAAILGITIMLLPILIVAPTYQYNQPRAASSEKLSDGSNEEVKSAQAVGESEVEAMAFPTSLVHAGVIAIAGLIVALAISFYSKKKLWVSV